VQLDRSFSANGKAMPDLISSMQNADNKPLFEGVKGSLDRIGRPTTRALPSLQRRNTDSTLTGSLPWSLCSADFEHPAVRAREARSTAA
jgi:hypothetical protein